MFCAPGLDFGGTEGVGSFFHVLRSPSHFRLNRGRRVPFPRFARPDSFSAVSWASLPVFMFSALRHVFGSRFHVLRSRTNFWRYQRRRVPFCAPGLIFDGTMGVGSLFLVLSAQTHFQRYRGRRVPFSCFARLDSFLAVPRALCPFSCFVLPDSFSAVPSASCPVFIVCAPGLDFDGTEGVGSLFHVLHSPSRFRWYRARRVPFLRFARPNSFSAVLRATLPVFMFSAPGHVFGGAEGVGSRFHVLRSRTRFRRYRGRRAPFSNFMRPYSFSAVPRVSDPDFMFCAPELVFGGTEIVGSLFHVFRSWTYFRRYRGRRVQFSYFALRTSFRWYRGHLVPFYCFACPDSFSAVPRASGLVFLFCVLILVFGSSGGFGSHFNVLHPRTHFRRYRGRRVPFSCFMLPDTFAAVSSASGPVFIFWWYRGRWVPFSFFTLPNSFSTVPRASGTVFMFCAPGLIFGDTVGVGSQFHVLRSRTRF
jgi:hypothetical protein